MSTSEKYISEALVRNQPKKPLSLKIKDGSVTTDKLHDEAVTTEKLADGAVTTPKIKDLNVTTAKIADKNVTTQKVADSAITTVKIADSNVTTEKIKDDAVVTDKIKDNNVTWEKLNDKVQNVIEAGTGVDGNLIADMEQWNDRIATLESTKLTPKTVITATEVVEWTDATTTIPVKISLQDSAGSINNDKNYTDKVINYSFTDSQQGTLANYKNVGEVEFDIPFTAPNNSVITAQGTAKYKGVNVSFDKVTKTVYAVLPSYMGYVESIDNLTDTAIQGLQKNVKHSLSGSYNITNSYSQAYFIVAVPKNGAVNGINRIVQHGLMDAVQTISRHDTTGYNVYVCSTAHNQGTYNFIIS